MFHQKLKIQKILMLHISIDKLYKSCNLFKFVIFRCVLLCLPSAFIVNIGLNIVCLNDEKLIEICVIISM